MTRNLSTAITSLASKDRFAPEDVIMLRREIFGDGIVMREEAEALFRLEDSPVEKCPEWSAFFVEAMTDYIVHQAQPSGYISSENAEWLIGSVSNAGAVNSPANLELLVKVLEEAKFAPESLAGFALEQVRQAVVEGKGPLMQDDGPAPGRVTKAEVDLLRRILYAFAGNGNVAITRSEADVLFAINDATAGAKNDASWNDLFVKAVANFVLCASGYVAPTRQEALRHDDFFARADADIGGFFARMVSGGVQGILESYRPTTNVDADWEARNRSNEARSRLAETNDSGEAKWLADRIGHDRVLHENEQALLTFIKRSSPDIHPDLKPLMDRVA